MGRGRRGRARAGADSRTRPAVRTVALTGGIGAGKTTALEAFARAGAATLSSDEIVHRLYAADDEVRAAIRERWGDEVVDDRAAIARIVFADPDELAWLEQVLHPRVRRAYQDWVDSLRSGSDPAGSDPGSDPPELAVVEIPLLYETGGETRFDAVVVITAPEDVRAARTAVLSDDRWRRLIPEDEKVRRADFAYVNDGTIEQLDAFVSGVVAALRS